ncbi:MAG TPA: hypothetical protein VG712_04300 [Gemmatimonadales bacterium]|nr:hypothetical protein [Gemmatimonadales bacterium]
MPIVRRIFANWPLKLTSLLLAILCWVVATLEEPIGRRVRARVELDPPADRVLIGAPTTATVQLTAPAREFLQLGDRPVTVLKSVVDSTEGTHTVELSPADVILPRGIGARALDVQPASFPVRIVARGGAELRERAWHGVPVLVPGPLEVRWLPSPDTVTVVVRGPAARLAALEAESLVVLARPDTGAGAAALRVLVPAGMSAEARPVAIRLQPRHP